MATRHCTLVLACITCLLWSLHTQADFDRGFKAWDSGNYKRALREFRKAAKANDTDAQNHLGQMYEDGQGAAIDLKTAVKWYTAAAERGNAAAQLNLGRLYRSGKGVEQNDTEAVRWYRKAAGQGLPVAQFFMGLLYDTGKGVPSDYVRAYKWFDLAARQGDDDARHKRDRLEQHMTPSQVIEAERLTRIFLGQELAAAPAAKAQQGGPERQTNRPAKVALINEQPYNATTRNPPRLKTGPLSKEEIVSVQQILNRLSYNAGDADGVAGNGTRAAAARFRKHFGTPGSGTVNRDLLRSLRLVRDNLPRPSARPSSAKALVKRIQIALAQHGYEVGKPDGIIGRKTNNAASSYRKHLGFEPKAILNQGLLTVLETHLAVRTLGGRTLVQTAAAAPVTVSTPVTATNPAEPKTGETPQTPGIKTPETTTLVYRIQQALTDLSYNPGPVDGSLGSRTTAAIRNFQEKAQVTVDGKATLKVLQLAETALAKQRAPKFIEPKDEKELVKRMQATLAKLGFDPGPADGVPGVRTRKAIREYQSRARMKQTGEPSAALLKRLEAPDAITIGPHLRFVQPASARERIRRIQLGLNSLGYSAGSPDGVAGDKTRSAAQEFQRRASLPADGRLTVALLRAIEAPGAARASSKRRSASARAQLVKEIQIELNRLGYPAGKADGIIGRRTIDAARNFQHAEGLPSTGKLTPSLLRALQSAR
ncbi:MAG: hypothetical protein GKR94_03950 [Gammaproteobacteria bacterium]|nr:hypothetical protein [Gammaproteobacteria bacterium]